MLAPEAVVVSDGGGKVAAALRPVRGPDEAAQRITELLSVEPGTALSVEAVNGQAGVVLRRAGQVMAVVSLNVTGRKVMAVWIVLNPDKLRHWV
jgi:RNA polymerase sigma-70 factor (ECF subfamily)